MELNLSSLHGGQNSCTEGGGQPTRLLDQVGKSVFDSWGRKLRSSGKRVAHGVSRGFGYWKFEPRSGERKSSWTQLCRPWQGFSRGRMVPHGSRRGLPSSATPWRTARSPVVQNLNCARARLRAKSLLASGDRVL